MNSRKYAEDLVGKLNTEQYGKQREVANNAYQSNWDNLVNQYKNLQDNLEKKRQEANRTYAEGLTNVASNSYDRSKAGVQNLVNRGLQTSGIGDLVAQSNTQQKGQEVDKLLNNLTNVYNSGSKNLASANTTMANNANSLGSNLSKTLGDIGQNELNTKLNYNSILAGIAGSKDVRDASNELASMELSASRANNSANENLNKSMENYQTNKDIANLLAGLSPDGEVLDIDDSQKEIMLKTLYGVKNAKDLMNNFTENSNFTARKDELSQNVKNMLSELSDAIINNQKTKQRYSNYNGRTTQDRIKELLTDAELKQKMSQSNYDTALNNYRNLSIKDLEKILYE